MQKITPFLWFNDNAEEAIQRYLTIFKNARIVSESRSPQGALMSATFELEGQSLMALNGGPHYSLTPAFSLFVNCETQEEVDELWEKLIEGGGKPGRCGWLEDKYGVSWQIIPSVLGAYLQDKDAGKANNVMQAMLRMDKLNIAALEEAYEQ